MSGKLFTAEQKNFITSLVNDYGYKEIVKMFNQKYPDRPITHASILQFTSRNGIKLGANAVCKAHTRTLSVTKYYVGEERRNTGGFLMVKISYGNKLKGQPKAIWKLKKVLLWEQYNNKLLPKSWCVIALDRNEDNFSKENLYAVSLSAAKSFYSIENHNPGIAKECGPLWVKTVLMLGELHNALVKKGVNRNSLFVGKVSQ